MNVLKFLGWAALGLVLFAGLVYGFLPTIAKIIITQGLTDRGFTNVAIIINRPGFNSLTIPLLTFHTPPESGSASISIDNTEITYSLNSLLNNVVEYVNVDRIKIVWDSSLLEKPSASAPSSPSDSPFDLRSMSTSDSLPVLPFQHLLIKQVDISNPLAPPTLQRISLNANMDALPNGYAGSVHLEADELLLNQLTFSLTPNGTVSLTGSHTRTPDDPVIDLQTSLAPSASGLALQGRAALKLHPMIQTLAAVFPIAPEYQAVTGNVSGTWTGTLQEKSAQTDSPFGAIQGDFTLNAHMPTLPPLFQDIQILTHGKFSVEGSDLTVIAQPSSSGSVNVALDSLTSPALTPYVSHKGLRTLTWDIQKPIRVSVPIKSKLDAVQIPSGSIHIAMQNASEQLDVVLSPQNLRWKPSSGVEGKGDVSISTQFKPAAAPSLSLEALSLEATASVSLLASQVAVVLNEKSLLHLSDAKNKTVRIPEIESQFPKGLSANYHTKSKAWQLQAPSSTLAIPSLFLEDKQWKLGEIFTNNLRIHSTSNGLTVDGTTTITAMQPPETSFDIPLTNWQSRYSLKPSSATIQFKGHTQEHPVHIDGQVQFNRLTNEGSATMRLKPIQFTPETLVLSQLIQPWTFPDLDVTHGTVSGSGNITFNISTDKIDSPFNIKRLHGIVDLEEIGGFLKPTIMEGLTTRIEILGEEEKLRIPATPLHIKNIQSVVGLTDTALLFSTKPFHPSSLPTLSITKLGTHLLGGMVSLSDSVIDPSAADHEVTLNVHGLDLNEILGLEQQETLKGTGKLDGILPLSIAGKDVTVKQGAIQGRAPGGTLQFTVDEETASAWSESQPQLDLIVKSLENYHYSKLEVGVDYAKNGILKLATTLEGKNPDFRNGVPIHFNLNIEENIPALIQSLSLVQGLEENIENMMEERGKSLVK